MVGILVAAMAFTLFGVCLARPSNTSYDCFTQDACKNRNDTSLAFNGKVFCCEKGDSITTKIISQSSFSYSSSHHVSNGTSRQSVANTKGPNDGDTSRDLSYNVTCKCAAVDYEKVESEISTVFDNFSRHFQNIFRGFPFTGGRWY